MLRHLTPAAIEWVNDTLPYSAEFDDIYFSTADPLGESHYVFLENNQLAERFPSVSQFTIIETGFGSGLNFLLTWELWKKSKNDDAYLHYVSIEKSPISLDNLQKIHENWPTLAKLSGLLQNQYPELVTGFHTLYFLDGNVRLTLIFDDADNALKQLHGKTDCWFLDGFAPARNPTMWSDVVFSHIARLSKEQNTTLSTFTAAGFVQRALISHGFSIEKKPGFGQKREMISARFEKPLAYVKHAAKPWFSLPSNTNKGDVAVIGGGIAGMSTAWHLATLGYNVLVLEKEAHLAPKASGNPRGIVAPLLLPENDALAPLFYEAYDYAIRHYQSLNVDNDISPSQHGVLQLIPPEGPAHLLRKNQIPSWVPCSLAKSVGAVEASALAGIALNDSGIYYPKAISLNPTNLCARYLANQSNRIKIHTLSDAYQLRRDNNLWQIVDPQGDILAHVPIVVIANSEDAALFPYTALLPFRRIRGQLTYLPETIASSKLRIPLMYHGYITPSFDRYHVVGATFTIDDHMTACRENDHQANIDSLFGVIDRGVFDPLGDSLTGRVAFRTALPDRRPCVGPIPKWEWFQSQYSTLRHGRPSTLYPLAEYEPGLYCLLGLGSRGLTLGPLLGAYLASLISGDVLPMHSDATTLLHPGRFLIRQLQQA